MTAARQPAKARFSRSRLALLALSCGAGSRPARRADPTRSSPTDRPAWRINGFDPVAYFTDRRPRLGRATSNTSHAGAVWRFRNDGNRAAFADHPDVYMPRFGGYDPVGIARSLSVAGNPLIWAVVGEQLYLFYSDARPAPPSSPRRTRDPRSRRAALARGASARIGR